VIKFPNSLHKNKTLSNDEYNFGTSRDDINTQIYIFASLKNRQKKHKIY